MGLFSKLVDKLKNGGDNDSATPSSGSGKDFVIENGVLVKYNGKDANVTIPEGVTSIGKEAFKDCKKLKSVMSSVISASEYHDSCHFIQA